MRAAVIVFPGSNCDRDLAAAFRELTGTDPVMVWHKDTSLPAGLDIIGVPGGFSFGDYLRCGAIAARSPICRAVVEFANRGGHVLGICNGFQVLTESGLLPGALMRNSGIRFVCKPVALTVATSASPFTNAFSTGDTPVFPVAHHDGNYTASPELVAQLRDEDRVAFRYVDNPNGSVDDIAGILSENRRVLGLMPHPERAVDAALGGTDGRGVFASVAQALVAA
ncbi:phosphoribosylformylglycinamidine synthase subunit PurQ [Pseudoruegeria sp. SK021]|uniref:phosphoribosylformylglycinamidine synthase subunit PurQ n=1 Tax=Pseudoruegeria sp. SK021 TaxID=1933035 RepID=UPI000A215E70|nr:phosphoribosylformylglycinamidine synthase subunit PurQ [Pseudoruegeria sp. SK021]OSP55556.1 phosphoribosylformylglycinamidine synthase I [Pseudoruegeria sp. SK021]